MLSQFTVTYTISLDDFEPWGDAVHVLDGLNEHPSAFNFINETIAEWSQCKQLTDVDVNDFLWFEALDLLANEGYYDVDEDDFTELAD